MESGQIYYKDFIATIAELCRTAMTGCLYFTTENNTPGRFHLKGGKILAIIYSNKKGWDAVTDIPSISSVRYRFDQFGASASTDDSLPSTDMILKTLAPEGVSLDANSQQTANTITQKQRDILEKALIEIIGPVGSILCDDHVKLDLTVKQVFASLSTELSSDEINNLKKLL